MKAIHVKLTNEEWRALKVATAENDTNISFLIRGLSAEIRERNKAAQTILNRAKILYDRDKEAKKGKYKQ